MNLAKHIFELVLVTFGLVACAHTTAPVRPAPAPARNTPPRVGAAPAVAAAPLNVALGASHLKRGAPATLDLADGFMATVRLPPSVSCQNVPTVATYLAGWDDAATALGQLLDGGIECTDNSNAAAPQQVLISGNVNITGTDYVYPDLQYRAPNVKVFAGRRFARTVFSAFWPYADCKLDGDAKSPCSVQSDGTVRLPATTPDNTQVTITFQPKAGKTPKLQLRVTTCGYHSTNSVPLVPNAQQSIGLDTADSCTGPQLPSDADVSLESGTYKMGAVVEKRATEAGGLRSLVLNIRHVPVDIPAGSYEWSLKDGSGQLIGTAQIPVSAAITASPNVDVHYGDERDALHDGKSQNTLVSGAWNTVHLAIPAAFEDSICEGMNEKCWRVTVQGHDLHPQGSLKGLAFKIDDVIPSEVHAILKHMTADAGGRPTADITVVVKLADIARKESVPYPIGRKLFVNCTEKGDDASLSPNPDNEEHTVRLNGTIPIRYDALSNGNCKLYIDADTDAPHLSDYGPQILNISIAHEGASGPFGMRTVLSPPKDNEKNSPRPVATLGAPTGDKDSGVPYVVRVTLGAVPKDEQVVYRSGTKPQLVDGQTLVWTDQIFQARLRSTGQYAIGAYSRNTVRMYITVPIDVAGIRFKAAPRDMKSSSDSTSYQFTGIRTGALLAVEPWNNVHGKNIWMLGPRLLGGLHGYGADTSKLGLSTVLGAGLSMPLLKNDTLETAVGVQFYWEHDLRQGGGNHLLVTSGLNVFSFLSGN